MENAFLEDLALTEETIKGLFKYTNPNFAYSERALSTSLESTVTDKETESGYKSSLNRVSLGTSYEQYEDLFFSPSLSISSESLTTTSAASANYKKQEGTYFDTIFSYVLTYDKRNSPYQPTDGFASRWVQDLPLVADGSPIMNGYSITGYRELLDDMIVSLGFYGRAVNSLTGDDVRVSNRLYLPRSRLRGFEQGKVGPRDGLMQLVGADAEVMRSIAETEGSRVLFSYGCSGEEGSGTQAATNLDAMNLDGRNITGISHTRGSGYMFGLQSGLPIEGLTWDELRAKDFEGRLEAINDETFCNALVTEAREPKSCGIPLQKVYFLGLDETPDHNSAQNLIELSKSAGEHWSETILRLSRDSNGRGLFNWRMFGGNLKEQGDLFASENLIPGLGDVGAHVSQIMDGGWASFILSHYVREKGVFTLPQAIKRMTADPAAVVGLSDRGILKAGMKADINVFNPEEVNELQPLLVNDFPGDAPRYIQKSRGFKATIVNGQVNVLNGEPTGARAGQVLRHQ